MYQTTYQNYRNKIKKLIKQNDIKNKTNRSRTSSNTLLHSLKPAPAGFFYGAEDYT